MDMDFAIISPLVRPVLPRIRFLSVRSRLCSTLPSDPASRRRPGAQLHPSPPSGWIEDFHLQAAVHARHTKRRRSRASPENSIPKLELGNEVKTIHAKFWCVGRTLHEDTRVRPTHQYRRSLFVSYLLNFIPFFPLYPLSPLPLFPLLLPPAAG